jgi:hypothetical protein
VESFSANILIGRGSIQSDPSTRQDLNSPFPPPPHRPENCCKVVYLGFIDLERVDDGPNIHSHGMSVFASPSELGSCKLSGCEMSQLCRFRHWNCCCIRLDRCPSAAAANLDRV